MSSLYNFLLWKYKANIYCFFCMMVLIISDIIHWRANIAVRGLWQNYEFLMLCVSIPCTSVLLAAQKCPTFMKSSSPLRNLFHCCLSMETSAKRGPWMSVILGVSYRHAIEQTHYVGCIATGGGVTDKRRVSRGDFSHDIKYKNVYGVWAILAAVRWEGRYVLGGQYGVLKFV